MAFLRNLVAVSLAAVSLGAVLAAPASATTLVVLPTEKMFQSSDLVAVIDVQRLSAVETRGRIVTHVEARVAESFKGGQVGAALKVLVPGGTVDGLTQRVQGEPDFAEGETCVVFLRRLAPGVYQVIGLEQGKLSLQANGQGQWVVRRGITAHMLEPAAGGGGWQEASPPETEPMDAYFATLRRLAGAAR